MLRGKPASNPVAVPESSPWPGGETAFGTTERAAGIRFYRAKESFFRPYVLLRAMALAEGQLTFVFADDEVVVQGRGLHVAYAAAAEGRLAWLGEQGERFAAAGSGPVGIIRIELVPLRDRG